MSDNIILPAIQAMILRQMEDDGLLDFTAMSNAFEVTVEPGTGYFLRGNLRSKNEATAELLSTDSFAVVKPSDFTQTLYKYQEMDINGNEHWNSFGDNNIKMECTARHPGTTMGGDVEDGVDPNEKYPHYVINERTSPITTVAADGLYAIVSAGPGGVVSELKASYPMQLSARVDEARQCLNLDCFEYKPSCILLLAETKERPIPLAGDMKRFEDCFDPTVGTRGSPYDSDEESLDCDDEEMQAKIFPRNGKAFTEEQLTFLNYQSMAGKFASSRCMRIRIPLSDVVGVRLMAPKELEEDEKDNGAILILEIPHKLARNAFAARKVHSRYNKENAFTIVNDWTPSQAASQSSRFYLYGTLAEMKRTAALMARLCPHIAALLAEPEFESNTLKASISAAYASSPALQERSPKTKIIKKKSNDYKMTVDEDHKLLATASFVKNKSEAKKMNPCFKKAPTPTSSAWDGKPNNAEDVFEAILAEKGGQDTDILRAIILGDEAGIVAEAGSASDNLRSEIIRIFGNSGIDDSSVPDKDIRRADDFLLATTLTDVASFSKNLDQIPDGDRETVAELMSMLEALGLMAHSNDDEEEDSE